ncbi:hypothetical protein ACFO3J_23640 [Streptomyces polygonati]|uniref:Uncharacterized protein n=1 Tax=Streptomyces polygonati TaxID=1617087 RepID=A0ABV8HQY2_9ACTN
MAPQLQAFSLDSFGYTEGEEDGGGEEYGPLVSKEAAEVAAGAVVWGEDGAASVAESDAIFILLEELPERSYTANVDGEKESSADESE